MPSNYKQKTFKELLIKSKKYEDLFKITEGKLAIVFGFLFSVVFSIFLDEKPIDEINSIIKEISLIFIPCLIGALGFILSGLAFVSGTISLKATEKLFEDNKIEHLESIFFTFYFLAFVTGIDIVLYVIVFLASLSSFSVNKVTIFLFSLPTAYLSFFIIFYSIGLLDTCINVFFINYKYNKE